LDEEGGKNDEADEEAEEGVDRDRALERRGKGEENASMVGTKEDIFMGQAERETRGRGEVDERVRR